MPTEIQKRIIQFRKQKGLTQSQMADLLQISRTSYAYNETRATRLDHHFINKVAKILEVAPIILINGMDVQKPMILHQDPPTFPQPPKFMATHKEQKMIEMLRCIPKEDRAAFFDAVTDAYKKCQKQ